MNRYAIGSLVLISAPPWQLATAATRQISWISAICPAQWTGIVGTDDKPHSLADYKASKAVVVVFTSNHCPVATAYEDRLIALQKDYKDKGVQVIAINVNKNAADNFEAMKKRTESTGINSPYLYDPTQKVGRDYGTACTPHVFVLNKDGKLAYKGAIGDNMKANKVEKHYVQAGARRPVGRQDAANRRDPAKGLHHQVRMRNAIVRARTALSGAILTRRTSRRKGQG